MTNPHSNGHDPVQTWRHLYLNAPHAAPSVAASVAAAFRFADVVWRQVAADPTLDQITRAAVTEQAAWARTALAAYQHLTETHAYTHLDLPTPLRCRADQTRLRDWLTSPSDLPGFAHLTVAESWNIDDDFTWDTEGVGTTMATLVTQAQHAGLFGVPGYTIAVQHVLADDGIDAGDNGAPIVEHQVTLTCPSGAVLASAPIAADHLADDQLSGVDAAVAVLTNTAAAVDELLAAEHRIITSAHDRPAPNQPDPARPNRGFTTLDLTAPGAVMAASQAPQPRHDRTARR